MVSPVAVLRKCKAVAVKGPATLRNIVYGRFGYWPVARLKDPALRDMPIYCIALRSAVERRALILRQAEGLGFTNLRIVDAVESAGLDYATLERDGLYDDALARRFHGRSLSKNELGCSLSHGLVYEMIAAEDHPIAMVVEDDALFISRRMDQIRLAELPADFDLVYLNSFRDKLPPTDRISGNLYGAMSYTGSTAAYFISRRGAEKLARAYKPVVHAADGLLGRSIDHAGSSAGSVTSEGARTSLRSYQIIPDCVLNGSVCYYHQSLVATRKPVAKTA